MGCRGGRLSGARILAWRRFWPQSGGRPVNWGFFGIGPVKKIDLDAYRRLRDGGTVLEFDHHGEKVIRLADGNFLKIFRRKHLVSSAMFYPYAQRFADNCQALNSRHIPCPNVVDVFRVSGLKRDVVCYQPLPGKTIRQLVADGLSPAEAGDLRRSIGAFVARLHRDGIYFRSLHLGNVVLTPDGRLGLIDLADLTIRRGELNRHLRIRNMRHLQRYPDDNAWLQADSAFDDGYRTIP